MPTDQVSLAVIPAGTGNDWVRMYGISKTYAEAVRSLVKKRTIIQDVARLAFTQATMYRSRAFLL